MNTAYSLNNIVKEYVSREGLAIRALDGITLQAESGEITCMVGPTASGKTTVLRVVSGIESPDSGTVRIAGIEPRNLRGKIGYLTQHHTLLPWMTVEDNIELPKRLNNTDAAKKKLETTEILESLGLAGAEKLYPYELSGGMKQRAALGRLLASGAPYWLMDEPFSSLDERTQHHLQKLFLDIVKESQISVLFVTHSIDEAVFLADRIVVLSTGPGKILESFKPDLPHPRNRLSQEYGSVMEQVRRSIESILTS